MHTHIELLSDAARREIERNCYVPDDGRFVAVWTTPTGKYPLVLFQTPLDKKFDSYSFTYGSGMGSFDKVKSDQDAIATMEKRINRYQPGGIGSFVPSTLKRGLERKM